jgi:phosphoglycolate phosphatase
MVGDTEADIMAGQTHGIPTVAVTCGIRSSSDLQSFRPTHLVANLWTACQMLQQRTTLRQQPR